MFEKITEVYDYLFAKKGSSPIENLVVLFDKYDNFHLKLKTIHVTGTNGKGSTTNYIASILSSANYKVGTFTSPHIIIHNDRIKINNCNIPDEVLLYYVNKHYDEFEKGNLGMFQIDTFISLKYFYDQKVDFAVIEVGIGGLSDCTNLILPLISVITSIGLDHMAILGKTLEDIAYQKSGIIKPMVPVVINVKDNKAMNVVKRICNERKSLKIGIKQPDNINFTLEKVQFDYENIKDISLINAGLYQLENASLAIETIKCLNNQGYVNIKTSFIKKGLETTYFPGRFEIICKNPYIIVDGAHNIHGINALLKTIKHIPNKVKVLYSSLVDKNPENIIEVLKKNVVDLTICEFSNCRAYKLKDINQNVLREVRVIIDYQEAIKQLTEEMEKDEVLIITGSLYFVSEVRKYLKIH